MLARETSISRSTQQDQKVKRAQTSVQATQTVPVLRDDRTAVDCVARAGERPAFVNGDAGRRSDRERTKRSDARRGFERVQLFLGKK
jgi:hypothetical protein